MRQILRNIDNKVIRQNSGGKILKANYNFGKAFHSGSSRYIRVHASTDINLTDATIGYWIKGLTSPIGIFTISDENYFMTHHSGGGSINETFYQVKRADGMNESYFTQNINYTKPTLFVRNYAKSSAQGGHFYRNLEVIQTGSVNYIPSTADVFAIGRSERSNAQGNYYYLSSISAIGELWLFERSLSATEVSYLYNNKLGNNPISNNGLAINYRMHKSEILDFSAAQDGSDMRVGVRNYGSIINAHGEIIGLPAGTLEEKEEWANANLFVNFL